jgi:hypothetical protein
VTSDENQNVPAVPEPSQSVAVVPIPIAEFEGELVRYMYGKLPGITLQMDYGYARGTHLKLELEVRVRSVEVDEMKGKNAGELSRLHNFVIEEAKILGAYTAEQLDPGVGGSAAATGNDIEDEDAEEATETDVNPKQCGSTTPHGFHTYNESVEGSYDYCPGVQGEGNERGTGEGNDRGTVDDGAAGDGVGF